MSDKHILNEEKPQRDLGYREFQDTSNIIDSQKLIIVMVGLPARGKSYIR